MDFGPLDRPVQFYEFITSFSNITLMAKLHGKIQPDNVKEAFNYTRKVHPYLRMIIQPTNDTPYRVKYHEMPDQEILLEYETRDINNEQWKESMQQMGNSTRDLSQSLSYLKLVSSSSGDQHEIYWSVNHSGIDGVSVFTVFNTFLEALGQICDQKKMPMPRSREFIDIIGRAPKNALDIPRLELPEKYILPLSPPEGSDPKTPAEIHGCWAELDKKQTEKLLQNCKTRNISVQGALSTALMLTVYKLQHEKFPLPQNFVNMIPVNMRPYVDPPVESEDCASGSAGVLWNQHLTENSTPWKLAEEATARIKEELQMKRGLRWWAALSSKEPPQIPTVMCSTIGLTPLKLSYGSLTLKKVRLLGGAYKNSTVGSAGIMTHIYTVNGVLYITFASTTPPFGGAWAKEFLDRILNLLNAFIDGDQANNAIIQFV
jgi:hypothetical protein